MAMRLAAVVGVVLVSGLAHGQPTPTSFDACKERRRAAMASAMKVSDVIVRGRLLAALPVCRRFEDGSIEVTEPPPPPAPDTTPFAPHLQLAAHTGVSATFVMARNDLSPSGAGPFVELEGGYRWRRSLSLTGVAGYTHFADDNVAVSNGVFIPASIITVSDNIYMFGARLNWHFRAAWLGGGLGFEIEDTTGYHGMQTTRVLRSVEGYVGYRVATSGRFDAEAMVIVGDAGRALDTDRELISARCVIGLRM